ncbi:MAG TPA: sodium/proline symporter [Candidatus Babeliales bacterium]|jgi:sodium/proline symporter|nr:sodium/proline symporter [Candidatus Babeliales bacterium]
MYFEYIVAFVVYSITIISIGIFASYKKKYASTDSIDFMIGGRSTHWLLTALSAHAADMSDWLFMGLPATVYLLGGTQIWIPIGLLFGMFCSWHFVAHTLRIATEQYRVYTLASYFKVHFKDHTGLLGITATLISFFFFAIYVSVGLKGIGYVLQSAFGMNYHIGICIGLCIILPYLLLGGFSSVAFLDLFQGLFLLAMLMLVPLYAYITLGGWHTIAHAIQEKGISLSLIPNFSLRSILAILLNPFAWCLGYFGMPHILTKFMGIENPEEMYKAKYVGIIWQLCATSAAVAVGVVGIAYFNIVPGKPEFIFIEMAKSLFTPLLAGLVLCAILAATISTIDSQLLVLAGIVAQDLYKNIINPSASAKQVYTIYQMAIIAGALLGLISAWNEQSSIMALVQYAWAGLGASFGPLVLVSLYSSYPNSYGAFAGLITGAFVSGIWQYINPYITTIEIYSMVPAFCANIVMIYAVSWLSKK